MADMATLRDPYHFEVVECDPQTGMAIVTALLTEWHGIHGWHADGWGPTYHGSPMHRAAVALHALITGETEPDDTDLDPSLLID